MTTMRLYALLSLLVGCGDDSTATDTPTELPSAIDVPTRPSPPVPASLSPCAMGWRTIDATDEHDVAHCDPWPVGGPAACPDGEAHFPGEPGCEAIGTACPGDGWPADLPAASPILYVQAGAPSGGTGSRASPFARVTEAVTASIPGTIIAIARGTYSETLLIDADVTLWGSCPTETIITPPVDAIAVRIRAGTVGIKNLMIAENGVGVLVEGGAVTIEGSMFERLVSAAWLISGGSVTANTIVIDSILADADGTPAHGIEVTGSASLELRRAVVSDTEGDGVVAFRAGTHARLFDVHVLGRTSEDTRGRGLVAIGGALVEGEGTVVERNSGAGVMAQVAGSTVRLTDSVVRTTSARISDGLGGFGLYAEQGGRIEGTRCSIGRNHAAGVLVRDPTSSGLLSHVRVEGTEPQTSDGIGGAALVAELSASLQVSYALMRGNHHGGVDVRNGATFSGAHLTIADTLPDSAGVGGGVYASSGTQVALTWALITGNIEVGIAAARNAMVSLTDVAVVETRARASDQRTGIGLVVQSGASVIIHRVLLEDNQEVGAFVSDPMTTLGGDDLTVRETQPGATGFYGRGLQAQDGANVTIARALLERNHEAGVVAASNGTTISLSDAVVSGTLERGCAATTCMGEGAGHGVVSGMGGLVTMERFTISDNAFVGLQIAAEGNATLTEGVVVRNPVAVNVQNPAFDLSQIRPSVIYQDNVVNLDMIAHPVPDPYFPIAL